MNEQCIPLAPNTGIAPTDQGLTLTLAIIAVLAFSGFAVLLILNRKKLKKLLVLPVALLLGLSLVLTGGVAYAQTPPNCEQGSGAVTVNGTVVATEDTLTATLPSEENGFLGTNLLVASKSVQQIGAVPTINSVYDAYPYAYTYPENPDGPTQPLLTRQLLANDTVTGDAVLDAQSVDLDPSTSGVQRTFTRDGYTLTYNPATDTLSIEITNAELVFSRIIPDTIVAGMTTDDFNAIANRDIQERLETQVFTYTVKDTTGTTSSTANITFTTLAEAILSHIE